MVNKLKLINHYICVMTAKDKLKNTLREYKAYDVKCASISLESGEKLFLKIGHSYEEYDSFMRELDNHSVVFGHVWLGDYIWLETDYKGDFIFYALPIPPKECKQ